MRLSTSGTSALEQSDVQAHAIRRHQSSQLFLGIWPIPHSRSNLSRELELSPNAQNARRYRTDREVVTDREISEEIGETKFAGHD